MIPDNPKNAFVVQDGDFWTAIIDGEPYERFKSEEDAWDYACVLCGDEDDRELADATDLETEIATYERAIRIIKAKLRNATDPDEKARAKRTLALNEKWRRQRVLRAAGPEGARRH